jgi:hypothetical protein
MSKTITIEVNNTDTNYWYDICTHYVLSEDLIRRFSDKINWSYASYYQRFSEDFIREFTDRVCWYHISEFQKLSEGFIKEFSDKICWSDISYAQKLSEEFIRENSDRLHWGFISQYQKLSEGFIREFINKINIYNISCYQKLSPEFIKEYNLDIPETCWLYKDKEYKRKYIKEHTSYEIIGDKVIAYKACRSDGYSCYNFQYHYEVGKEYEAHADYNIIEDDSFGLSAWTKERSLDHHSTGKLFKVEIDLEDIAVIICGRNKIRASKIKIVEEIKI